MCGESKIQRAECAPCSERPDAQSEEGLVVIQPVKDF